VAVVAIGIRVGVILRLAQRVLPHHRANALELLRQLDRAATHARHLLCHVPNTLELFLQKVFSHRQSRSPLPEAQRMSCQPAQAEIRAKSISTAEI